jgi:hypothetical protein
MQIHELTKKTLNEVDIAGPGGLVSRAKTAYQAAKQPGALKSLYKSQQVAPPGSNMWQRAKTALASNPLTSSSALAKSQFAQAQSGQRIDAQVRQVATNLQNQWLNFEQQAARSMGIDILPPDEYRNGLESWFKKSAIPKAYDADEVLDPLENDPGTVNRIKQTFDQITNAAQTNNANEIGNGFLQLVPLIRASAQNLTSKDDQAKAAARTQYKQAKQAQATGAAQPQVQPQAQQPQASVVTPATIAQTLQNFGINANALALLQKSTPQLIGAATVGSTGNANADNLLKALGLQVQ